jgi:hypothetical protein
MEHSLLTNALVYLAAAVVAVPLSKRLGMGTVLGYLAGRHPDRALWPSADRERRGRPALRRIRRRAAAVPDRPGTRARPPVGAAPADLRLGRRPGAGRGGGLVRRGAAGRGRLEAGPDRRPRAVAVLDRDRPGLAGGTQPDADAGRPGRLRDPAVPGHRRDPDDRHRADAGHARRRGLGGNCLAGHAESGAGAGRPDRRRPLPGASAAAASSPRPTRARSSPPSPCCW